MSQYTAPRAAAPGEETPFAMVMSIWTRWMNLHDHQTSSGDAPSQDTKDFMRTGEAINTMVDDLPRLNWWAVRKSRGICTAWRFPGRSYEGALMEAEEILTSKMKKHIAVRRYFN